MARSSVRRSVKRVIAISAVLLGLIALMFLLLRPRHAKDYEYADFDLPELVDFDLDSIRARGKLVVLTENSASTYYLYKGTPKGFDYEVVRAFAKSIHVKLEIRVIENLDSMFAMLYRGEGDVIASNLTITPTREQFLKFTPALYQSEQVLVQRIDTSNKNLVDGIVVHDTLELGRLPIHVHRYTAFYNRLVDLNKRNALNMQIIEASGKVGTDELLQEVATGAVPATVTDKSLAFLYFDDYPELDMSVAIGPKQGIGWAMRPNASKLSLALETFINSSSGKRFVQRTYGRYFGRQEAKWTGGLHSVFTLPILTGKQISPYDSLYKVHSKIIGWDWRLLAALSFVESGFHPDAESWAGARGLMQLMPATMEKYGCDTLCLPDDNIRAGAKYIHNLDRFWLQYVKNPNERVKFILASYNVGPGHIVDAMCIARQLGKSDTLWENNVAEAVMLKTQRQYYAMPCVKHGYLNGAGPINFVNKILSVFHHYQAHVK